MKAAAVLLLLVALAMPAGAEDYADQVPPDPSSLPLPAAEEDCSDTAYAAPASTTPAQVVEVKPEPVYLLEPVLAALLLWFGMYITIAP